MTLLLALAATTAQAAAPTPSPSQLALYKALSPRHLEQSCAEVAALSTEPAADLVWVAENAEQPAWVAIRAAECVVGSFAEPAAPALTRWMQSETTLGLALTVVTQLDSMPLEQARPLLAAGLAGPHAERLRPRAEKLAKPELLALLYPLPQ
jgi:hypothetical protein